MLYLTQSLPRHADEKQRLQMRGEGESWCSQLLPSIKVFPFVQMQTKEELLLDSCVSNVVLSIQLGTDPGCCWSAMTASGGDGALGLAQCPRIAFVSSCTSTTVVCAYGLLPAIPTSRQSEYRDLQSLVDTNDVKSSNSAGVGSILASYCIF